MPPRAAELLDVKVVGGLEEGTRLQTPVPHCVAEDAADVTLDPRGRSGSPGSRLPWSRCSRAPCRPSCPRSTCW
eukprot:15438674-Alexandrium_andersonii.AAC.1